MVDLPERVGGVRFFPVEFDKHQQLVDPPQVAAVRDHVGAAGVTDLLVVSHGWNNDMADAMALYRRLLENVGRRVGGAWDGREVAVLGVFWPSKRFADEDLIPGGAASLEGDVPQATLVAELEALRDAFDDDGTVVDRLLAEVPHLTDRASARREFVAGLRELVAAGDDEEVRDEIPSGFFSMDGAELLDELGMPREEELAAIDGERQGGIAAVGGPGAASGLGAGGTEGGAAFLGSAFSGIRSGARNALNLATYYTMKRRAGDTGRRGLAPVLRDLRSAAPELRLHLAGHSFGGRLVAAAALGEDADDPALPVDSLTLLQAAFSHHGFSTDHRPGQHGYFRDVLVGERLRGPLMITHTHNDRANTWAYPMASRVARQRAASFGGPNDVYGAIGSNGALATPGAGFETLHAADEPYDGLEAHGVVNLEASSFIADHGAVDGVEVAHLLVSVVAAS
jgi:hypothetical protein